MLAWKKYGNGETPETSGKKGDHLVGDYYVSFDKHYKAEVKELMAQFTAQGMNDEEAKAKAEAESDVYKRQLVNGEYVVQKYLYDYDPAKPYEKKGRWFLNRAAQVLLRYAEAVNRCGYTKLAYSILNEGFKTTYRYTPESEAKREWDCVTSYEYGQPYPEPFYFDARSIDCLSLIHISWLIISE